MARLGVLGVVQVATILATAGAFFASLLFLHHQTDDYFTPLPAYLSSFKVAIPPVAAFVVSYAIAFLTGTALSDVPKAVLSFARNTFFQSQRLMLATIVSAVVLMSWTAWLARYETPPSYGHMVRVLLAGGSDNLAGIKDKVAEIRKVDEAAAARLGKVVEVFLERSEVNAGHRALSGDRARVLVSALEADDDPSWTRHPLRNHALAESYSLLGQSIVGTSAIVSGLALKDPNAAYRQAITLYGLVAGSTSPLATDALKSSARSNTGNVEYYMGNYGAALKAWRAAASGPNGEPNLAPWSNEIVALVMLDDPKGAIVEGEKAKAWAEKSGRALIETYSFAGVMENTAMARLQVNDVAGAVSDLAIANAFRDDDLTRQNLALALTLAGRSSGAQRILRQIAPPLDPGEQRVPKIAACVYLIWGLALADAPPAVRAANFNAFLGRQTSKVALANYTSADLKNLITEVAVALPNADKPCGSLGKIKAVVARLTADTSSDPRATP